jgi:small multidrug resistance pump
MFFAIVFEVAGTLTLKFTEGMTRPWPTVGMFALYLVSLFGLSVAVSKIPVGTAYAVGLGLGTLAVPGAFWLMFILPAAARVVK